MGHKVGYDGADSMREKAKRLFGNQVEGVSMTDVSSASAPSKTPMRKYAKGGSVKREGSMLPKSAKGEVQGGTLTDMHMPKKREATNMKKGGKVACYKDGGRVDRMGAYFPGRPEDMKKGGKVDPHGAEPSDKAEYKKWIRAREDAGLQSPAGALADKDLKKSGKSAEEIREANKRHAKHRREAEASGNPDAIEYKRGGAVDKVKMREDKGALGKGKALKDKFKNEKSLASKSLKKPYNSMEELGVERKYNGQTAKYKKGGPVEKTERQRAIEETASFRGILNKTLRDAYGTEKSRGLPQKNIGKPSKEMGGKLIQEGVVREAPGFRKLMESGKIKKLGELPSGPIRKLKDLPEGELEYYKRGGAVKGAKANTTSTMRRAMKGRSKFVDQTTKRGNALDVGSVKQVATPKKSSMLHPKAASNGDKHSKYNVESVPKMNGMPKMKSGGKAKSKC